MSSEPTMSSEPLTFTIKWRGASHTITLASRSECPYAKISSQFGLNKEKVKILRAGKTLPPAGAADLPEALVAGATYMVMGTPDGDALPTTTQRYVQDARDFVTSVRDFFVGLYAQASWTQFWMLFFYLCSSIVALGRASIAFVTSMVIAPQPAAPGAANNRGQRRPIVVEDGHED